uniref:Uncharacterized protein n=1 Tax=Ananas comosus var. bracteatus TaxID=296719 RepID=A0A6V7QBB1_ANACO|nr:unnamed protein product [Ananas comosus var. bracteatus]
MRSVAISDALPPPPLSVPQSVWHSPVSFLFGGLARCSASSPSPFLSSPVPTGNYPPTSTAAVAAVPQPPPLNWRQPVAAASPRRRRASWSSWRETTSPRSSPCRCVATPWTCPCRVVVVAATRVR